MGTTSVSVVLHKDDEFSAAVCHKHIAYKKRLVGRNEFTEKLRTQLVQNLKQCLSDINIMSVSLVLNSFIT